MPSLTLADARAHWSAAQGLDAPVAEPVAATLERTGWVRTLGGVEAYLALHARNPTASVDAVHAALEAGEVCVSPAVRGCIYLVPRSQAALCLRIAQLLSAKRIARDHSKLGLDEAELDTLGEAILRAVAETPLSTAELRKALPEDAIRSLGDAGKKVGVTSTLPPALRRLEFQGRLKRAPVDHRLDHERYAWSPDDLEVGAVTDADLGALATLYLRWAGPSTRKELASWTGLNQTQAKRGLAATGATPATLDDEDVFVGADAPRPATGALRWLPAMDNLFALRANARHLVDPAYHHVGVANFGPGGLASLATTSQPIDRLIVRDGEVVGMWAWDPSEGLVHTLAPHAADADAAEEAQRVAATLDALGHAKVFSIDSDARLTKRATRLRGLDWT